MRFQLDAERPRVCLTLTGRTLRENLEIVERERELVDICELRADHLDDSESGQLSRFPNVARLPAILTFRRRRDGGARQTPEQTRLEILNQALEGDWAYVDLEEDLDAPWLDAKAVRRGIPIIRSFHDFDTVPDGLAGRLRALVRSPNDVARAAVMPHSVEDLLRLLDVAESISDLPAILVGLGEWGVPARVLPARFGTRLVYCSAAREKTSPGDLSPAILRRIYRFGEVSSRAEIFCVIGNPILHSRSPWIHNPGFRALGLDAIYVPIPVDSLSQFMTLAERLPIAGASVTVPHKEQVRRHLSEIDSSVEDAGACNTLVRTEGGWRGYNTDIAGFLAPLEAHFGEPPAGKRALVVGAGGAARAVVAGLRSARCRVSVVNRTEERSAALANHFACSWVRMADLERAGGGDYDIIVQATSAGMTPNEAVDPLPAYRFRGNETVYELVYAPPRTRFLQRAEQSGCTVIGGGEMLRHQAYAQFRLFTGQGYPLGAIPGEL